MIKAIPVSILIASIALPMWYATRQNPKKSLRKVQLLIGVLALLWAILCIYVYPRFVLPE